MKSETPRTDAATMNCETTPPTDDYVYAEFARELERENAQLVASLKFIAQFGGSVMHEQEGIISCNGSWCAEMARSSLPQDAWEELQTLKQLPKTV